MSDTDIFQQFSSFEALHDSVLLIDSGGLVVAANISALKMLVLTETQLIGSPFSDYFPNVGERFQEGNGEVIEITGCRSDGSGLLLEGRSSVAYYNDSRCYLLVLRDRHGGVSLEEKQSSAAFDNTATRWPNLVEFCSRIRQQVESGAVPLDRTAMVIAISLGRLGFFAGTLGEATRLRIVREAVDRLGRLEAVSEIALLDDSTLGVLACIEDGTDDLPPLVKQLRLCVEVSYSLSENAARIVPHFGVSRVTDATLDPEHVVRQARFALNAAMQKAIGSFAIYEDETHREAIRHLVVEHDLRRAIFERKEEFSLVYQPKVDCRAGTIQGFEAMIRWNHPKRGTVGPNDFLPIARQAGIAPDLTFIVLERLVAQIKQWRAAGLTTVPVAFNIDADDVRENRLAPFLSNLLQDAGVEPSAIECELTETSVVADMRAAKQLFDQLVDMGVRTAVDDFGTGYSSLVHIIDLPIRVVKIDRSFVQTMQMCNVSNAVVQAIVAMTNAMGAVCVAEGVETYDQLARIHRLGCNLAQGYLFDEPLAPEAVEARLREPDFYHNQINQGIAPA